MKELENIPFNTLVKVVYKRTYRQEKPKRFIGSYKKFEQYKNNDDYYIFGHPYFIDDEQTKAGDIGLTTFDIAYIGPVSQQEACKWFQEYKKFHESVVKEKGCDICEENMPDMKLYTGLSYTNSNFGKENNK